jgi:hypothetical protein
LLFVFIFFLFLFVFVLLISLLFCCSFYSFSSVRSVAMGIGPTFPPLFLSEARNS